MVEKTGFRHIDGLEILLNTLLVKSAKEQLKLYAFMGRADKNLR